MTEAEKTFTCTKCKKTKKESQGRFILEGSAYCCTQCCGDPAKGEHKAENANMCEFC